MTALLLIVPLLCTGLAAEETTPLAAPDEAGAWDRARDDARLAKEFVRDDITVADDADAGRVTDWSFQLREGGFADIFLRRPIDRPFQRLRLRVRNLGEKLQLAVKVGDSSGAEWTVEPVALAADAAWQTVDFPLPAWRVASWSKDADGALTWPLPYLAVIAFGVQPGPSYQLRLGEVSLVRPEPADAVVTAEGLPPRMAAGATLAVALHLTLRSPLPDDGYSGQDAAVELAREGKAATSGAVAWDTAPARWQVGQAVTGHAEIASSAWLAGGPHRCRLNLPGVRLFGGEGGELPGGDLGEVTVNVRTPGPLSAEVKPYHGAPTIFLNGRPVPGMAYAAYGPTPEVFRDFGAAGVRLFSIMGTPTSHGYGLSADTWLAPDSYDYSQLDARFRMVLDACPEAYLFPRLYCSAPPWWLEQHPDAVVLYDPGDGKPVPFIQSGRKVPSWASPAWREATCDALRKLIAHVESQPYADRVVGYHIASGTTEEWMMWGANDDAWTDYSPDNLAAFRRWLTARYGTDAKLRAAWGQPDVTLADAGIPTKQQRAASAAGTLRNPATDTPSIDYIRYIADMTAETIDVLCGAVKDATHHERLTGVFYGYLLQLFGQRQQNAAHLGFDAVIRSPNVDFLCSPTSYMFRQVGSGTSHFMAPLGSVLAHNKLWFDENDIRTSLAPGEIGGWGKPADVAGDLLQQDKEVADVLTNGLAQWWFDVGRNRYDDPVLMRRLGELTTVAAETLEADRTPVDQVAMVVDGRGLADINVGDPLMYPLQAQQIPTISRLGAPVGYYELHDVDRLAERHRLILFAGLYEPSAEQRAAIDKLKSDGRVLIFTHAPAPYRDGRWDPAGMAEVCGLKLRIEDRELPAKVTYADHELVRGLARGGYGLDRPIRPVVVGADPEAEVLATLPDGSPGLLIRRYPDWTAVWSAAPALPTDLLIRLAELAKVHRYITTPDLVWATKGLLAVSVREAGQRTIVLPGAARVTDLYHGGETALEQGERFDTTLAAGATGMWRLAP